MRNKLLGSRDDFSNLCWSMCLELQACFCVITALLMRNILISKDVQILHCIPLYQDKLENRAVIFYFLNKK